MTKLSDFENQRPTGYVPDEGATEQVKAIAPAPGSKIRSGPSAKDMPEPRMSKAESIEYANMHTVASMRSRIVQLNEAIEGIRAEGNTIQEWEALVMVIHELERIIVNIPGYEDPVRGRPNHVL